MVQSKKAPPSEESGASAALQAVGERLNGLQQVRTSELLAGASTESRLTPGEVVRELLDRDDLDVLAAEAIDAARRSRLPGKAATLGQSLGATGSKLFGAGAILTVSDIGHRLGLQEAVLPLIEDLTRSGILMDPGAEGLKTEDEEIYELAPTRVSVGLGP